MTTRPLSTTTEVPQLKVVPVSEGAEAFVELLNTQGVKYLFLNPGTDTFPVQEAIARCRLQGKPSPTVVTCLHESVAMAAAHGYFMLTGEPQVVFVHVELGTQNVGGALHNAQRGRIGVLFCAGRSPITLEGELRGSRSSHIHWWQEQRDQAGIVRGYTKWDYELRLNENIHHVVQRAFQLASSEPCGPVYLTLPRELLMEKIEQVKVPPRERCGPVVTPQADPAALAQAATWLLKAEYPLILTATAGRNPQAVAALVALADLLAIPVIESRIRVNFPTDHPMYLGLNPSPYLERADVILLVDTDVPYLPAVERPSPQARVIQIDIDPVKDDMVLWNFPVDLPLQADSAKALPALVEEVRRQLLASDQEGIAARRRRVQEDHEAQGRRLRESAQAKASQKPIAVEWLAACLGEVIGEDDIVVNEAVTNAGTIIRHTRSVKPGTHFQSGGSSLGWALGAAVGAKLAAPDRTVFSIVGDGAFVFGCPTAALWAAEQTHSPFLTVILNNSCYNASKRPILSTYPDGASVQLGEFLGTEFNPPPEYEYIARACRAYGEKVEDPAEVKPALQRALEQVRAGKAAVLDVVLPRP